MSITIKMKADRFNSNRHVVYRMTRNHLPPRLSRNRIEFEFLWDKHRFMEDGGHGKQLWRRKSFSYTYAERNSRVEFSPPICVWSTAKPVETPNSQNLPRKNSAKQANTTSRFANPQSKKSSQLSLYSDIVFPPKKPKSVGCFSRNCTGPQLSFTSASVHHGTVLQAHFLHYGILDLGEHWAIGGHGSTPGPWHELLRFFFSWGGIGTP